MAMWKCVSLYHTHCLGLKGFGRELRVRSAEVGLRRSSALCRGDLAGKPSTYALQVDADINLPRRDAVDPNAGALEHGDAGPDDAERGVSGHGEGRAPAATVGAGNTANDDNGPVRV